MSFYQFVIGQSHEFLSVGIFSNLYDAFVCIDSSGLDFPVVITTDGRGFSFDLVISAQMGIRASDAAAICRK